MSIDASKIITAEQKAQQQLDRDNAAVKQALTEIDIQSVRSIREWLAQQADCPQKLLDNEAQAQAERAKLR